MNRRAVVTGGGRRVGRAIALELARHNFDLVIHCHQSTTEAAKVAESCRQLGVQAHVESADLETIAGNNSLATAIANRWSSLHLLVNNASLFEAAPFESLDAAKWQRMLDVNLRSPFLLSHALLPLFRRANGAALGAPDGQRGVVVHLCDIGAQRPLRGYTHYSVSKAGLAMLVKSMAVELAPEIRTVGVSPGQVMWPEHYDGQRRKRLVQRIPLSRVGTAEDVASLVRFLALEAHYVNGEIISVDGGLSCTY
ncbi:MAG: SDR family oxidoreductase [Proteobacteria bacterium]|jgi:pteridine reductase|nr:SDR family oxidoreductase [Pseudomonadota bacterium]